MQHGFFKQAGANKRTLLKNMLWDLSVSPCAAGDEYRGFCNSFPMKRTEKHEFMGRKWFQKLSGFHLWFHFKFKAPRVFWQTHQFHPGSHRPHRELCRAETGSGSSSPRSHAGGSSPEERGKDRATDLFLTLNHNAAQHGCILLY